MLLNIVFVMVLFLNFVILLFAKWRTIFRVSGVSAALVFTLYNFSQRVPILSGGNEFIWIIFGKVWFYFALMVLVKVAIQSMLAARRSRKGIFRSDILDQDPWIAEFDGGLLNLIGILAGLNILLFFARSLPYLSRGFDLHILIIGLAIAVIVSVEKRSSNGAPNDRIFGSAIKWGAIIIGIGAFLGLLLPLAIVTSAKHTAGDDPYCLALPSGGGQVRSLSALTFFSVGRKTTSRHLLLYVKRGDRFLGSHWSYFGMKFRDSSPVYFNASDRRLPCTPALNFGSDLPFFDFGLGHFEG